MWALAQMSRQVRQLLTTTANELACEVGFVQRASKLTGAHFAQSLIFGWLNNPQATLQQLAHMVGTTGVAISPQGLDQRFTPQAARFLRRLLEVAVTVAVSGDTPAVPLLQRFAGVYLLDSSTIVLPDVLAAVWQGSGGNAPHSAAAVRLQVQLDLTTGTLIGPFLQDGRSHDRSAPRQTQFPAGALRISDLGYFSTPIFRDLHQQGVYWLSRLHVFARLFEPSGNALPMAVLPAWLEEQASHRGTVSFDVPLVLGAAAVPTGIPVRLLAIRVPTQVAAERRHQLKIEARRKQQPISVHRLALADWTLFLTNAPTTLLTLEEAQILARARWQIELLFKLWKQQGLLDESRSEQPWRRLGEFYAKLLGLLFQHWLLVVNCWTYPDRSLTQATQTIRRYATALVLALPSPKRLGALLAHLHQCLSVGCRITKRKKTPATYQLLLAVAPCT